MTYEQAGPDQAEAAEVAASTVAATLELLSYVPPSELAHEELGEVLHMLAGVLRHPERMA